MIWWLAQHLLVTLALVGIVAIAGAILRNHPALRHALWLIVVLKFMTPAIMYWPAELQVSESLFGKNQTESGGRRATEWALGSSVTVIWAELLVAEEV